MDADFSRTARMASRCEVRAVSASTNADLRLHVPDAGLWPHLSVLLTENQTAGRGRLERQWVTPNGSALAMSVLLRELPIDRARFGWIPLLAGVAMSDAVARQLPGHAVGVKWPNDVLVSERKICGILAEVVGDAIVLGAGVNTRMTPAQLPVETATSFAALGSDVDVDALAADFVAALAAHLHTLCTAADVTLVQKVVEEHCLSLGRSVDISLPNGEQFRALAVGIGDDGSLIVDDGSVRRHLSSGDVVHARLG